MEKLYFVFLNPVHNLIITTCSLVEVTNSMTFKEAKFTVEVIFDEARFLSMLFTKCKNYESTMHEGRV